MKIGRSPSCIKVHFYRNIYVYCGMSFNEIICLLMKIKLFMGITDIIILNLSIQNIHVKRFF